MKLLKEWFYKEAEWWQFWRPGSGVIGGIIAGAILLIMTVSLVMADDVPDLRKTPGVARPGLTKEKICSIHWGKDERHVTAAMKRQAFKMYGYSGNDDKRCVPSGARRCEIDHLISRELGGADD